MIRSENGDNLEKKVVVLSELLLGDCLELMKDISDESIDMILADPPYQRTHNKWDSIIPIDKMWEQYLRIIKPNGCIAIFADGMFMADLMKSQEKLWRYNLVWDKVLSTGFLNANKQPLRVHEEICIFYKKPPTYNPQKTLGTMNHNRGAKKEYNNNNYSHYNFVDNREKLGEWKHPTSILKFSKPHPSVCLHPTEKSVELCEWLIKTYTNEGETVLDNCAGSGTTCIAAINTNRNYIAMESEERYYRVMQNRISQHLAQHDKEKDSNNK